MLLATKACIRRLGRMRTRVIGISLVIGLAMAMIVAGEYGGAVLDESVASYMRESKMPDLFVRLDGARPAIDVESALGGMQGVQAFSLEQHATGTSGISDGRAVHVDLVGIDDPARTNISRLELVQGRMFTSQGESVVVAGMESLGFGVGDKAIVQIGNDTVELDIVGVVRGAEYVYTSAFQGYIVPGVGSAVTLIVPLNTIPSFKLGEIDQVNVLLEEGNDGSQVTTALQPFGVVSVMEQKDHPSTSYVSLGSDKIKTMMPLIGYIFMAVGFVATFMTMARLVFGDSRHIGVLMSLGYSKGRIAVGYMAMGIVLALMGILIGVPLALLMTMGFMTAMVGMFFQMDIALPFEPYPFVFGAAVVLAAVLLAICLPVAMVTRRTVREALEYRPHNRVRASKMGSSRSMITRMGLRNAIRDPPRTVFTVLAIALTIGLAGSWLVMSESAMGYIDEQIDADTWDLRVDLSSTTETASIDAELLGLGSQDVRYVSPAMQVRAVLYNGDRMGTASLLASDDWEQVRRMALLKGQLDFRGLVIANDLAREMGLDVGDEVEAGLGSSTTTMTVTGIVSDVMSAAAYTSRANLAPLFSSTGSNLVFVALQQPSLASDAAAVVRSMPSVSSVLVHSDLSESMEEVTNLAISMLYGFFGICMLITIVVTGVAIMVSTLERDMEFATLSTLGASKKDVAKGIVVEMLVLGGMAALVSVPLSYLISMFMADAMSKAVFYFPVSISVQGTTVMVVLGLLLVMVSACIPIRYAWKLRTEQTLKERNAG